MRTHILSKASQADTSSASQQCELLPEPEVQTQHPSYGGEWAKEFGGWTMVREEPISGGQL